jgi:membrane-associated phospholipid phosphatase
MLRDLGGIRLREAKVDPIHFWGDVTLEVHRLDFLGTTPMPQVGGPTRTSRAFAMIYVAMHDSWSRSKSPSGTTYLQGLPPFPPGASREAGVAGAALAVIRSLYARPGVIHYIEDQLLLFRLFLLGAGQINTAIDNGLSFGDAVGQAMIANRAGDGSGAPDIYTPADQAGQHRADPYHPNQGYLGAQWGNVPPFGMVASDVTPKPPPALGTTKYNKAWDEVRKKGVFTGGTRTVDETIQAIFWAYDGAPFIGVPPRLYNQCVRRISLDKGSSVDENARLFALVNMGMANAGIFAWREKYLYKLWRPVLGIRESSDDYGPKLPARNAAADPLWRPLGSPVSNVIGAISFTPPFPAYPSGHATFGTACFELVRAFYGQNVAFEMVSDELDGITTDPDGSIRTLHRRQLTLTTAIKENLESRIWQGVHWRFDGDRGKEIGKRIADKLKTQLQ